MYLVNRKEWEGETWGHLNYQCTYLGQLCPKFVVRLFVPPVRPLFPRNRFLWCECKCVKKPRQQTSYQCSYTVYHFPIFVISYNYIERKTQKNQVREDAIIILFKFLSFINHYTKPILIMEKNNLLKLNAAIDISSKFKHHKYLNQKKTGFRS